MFCFTPSIINVFITRPVTLILNAHFQCCRKTPRKMHKWIFGRYQCRYSSVTHWVKLISYSNSIRNVTYWLGPPISWQIRGCPHFVVASSDVLLITFTPWKLARSVRQFVRLSTLVLVEVGLGGLNTLSRCERRRYSRSSWPCLCSAVTRSGRPCQLRH